MMASFWGTVRACLQTAVLWTSFKLVQTVVAAFFTVLVWIQTSIAFIGICFRTPKALSTVQQARKLAADKSKLQAAAAAAAAAQAVAGSSLQQSEGTNAAGLRQRRLPDASQASSIDQDQQVAADVQGVTPAPIHLFPEPELGAW
jgi:hypothetical protein